MQACSTGKNASQFSNANIRVSSVCICGSIFSRDKFTFDCLHGPADWRMTPPDASLREAFSLSEVSCCIFRRACLTFIVHGSSANGKRAMCFRNHLFFKPGQNKRCSMRYRVLVQQDEDGVFVAEVPALPGCISQGSTREETLRNIKEAIELYLESLDVHGEPVPPLFGSVA